MKIRNLVVAGIAALALTLAPTDAAYAADAPVCTEGYLLCLNEATQEEGGFWRTVMEIECGVGYFGCLRNLAQGG